MAVNEPDDGDKLQRWGRDAASALRASERVDAVTSARLSAARARAIAAAGSSPAYRAWALSAAIAAALLLAVALPNRAPPPAAAPPADVAAGDAVELLTDDQDPQFYQDLELYQWLDDDGNA
jgi:hypothetical protein